MNSTIKFLAASLGIATLSVAVAHADGIDPMFSIEGYYIDDLEIIGDVILPNGAEMVAFEMRNEHLKFFIVPEAAYVMIDANNPIIAQQTPFYGFWVSTQSVDIGNRPVCDYHVYDEYGEFYLVHGSLVWTNTGLSKNYDLAFNIQLGTCAEREQPWAFSGAAIEMAAGGVPHADVPALDFYSVFDANGEEYIIQSDRDGAVLVSLYPRDIVVRMATAKASYETFYEQEVVIMDKDCTATSTRRGNGSWSWANGGFVIDFEDIGFSFSAHGCAC